MLERQQVSYGLGCMSCFRNVRPVSTNMIHLGSDGEEIRGVEPNVNDGGPDQQEIF